MEVTVTISPSPEAISLGSSARVTRSVPSTLVSHIHRQLSISASSTDSSPLAPPALLTSTSTRSSDSASDATASPSVTSATNAVPPISAASVLDRVLAPCHAYHVKAMGGKGSRGRFADAGAGAGDHRDLAVGFGCRHGNQLYEIE